jgi:hypothetical protein
MRGKLRDKRTETKRESVKHELVERRRTNKRENRNIAWQYLHVDQEEEYIALSSDEQDALPVPGDG